MDASDHLFVACMPASGPNIVGEYTTSGVPVNSNLISTGALSDVGIAPNGNILVLHYGWGSSIDEFDTNGNLLVQSLTSGTEWPYAMVCCSDAAGNPKTATNGFGVATNGFLFSVTGQANQTVVIEACTNLPSTNWLPLQTNFLGANPIYFSDANWSNYSDALLSRPKKMTRFKESTKRGSVLNGPWLRPRKI